MLHKKTEILPNINIARVEIVLGRVKITEVLLCSKYTYVTLNGQYDIPRYAHTLGSRMKGEKKERKGSNERTRILPEEKFA